MQPCHLFATGLLLSQGAAAFGPMQLQRSSCGPYIVGAAAPAVPSSPDRGGFTRTIAALQSSNEIDISDLGLTMDDLNAPLPKDMLQVTSSGCQSTSRVPDVDDRGCLWDESEDGMDVTLSIPGLRGQPPASLSLDVTKNTATITSFGMAVWSCILRGNCVPETASFGFEDGDDMVPLLRLSVQKADSERWGGFIAGIGEDSIL